MSPLRSIKFPVPWATHESDLLCLEGFRDFFHFFNALVFGQAINSRPVPGRQKLPV